MDNSPIGVFDSGMGGLSVWRELKRDLPRESLIYFGDGKNCPYGEKPEGEVAGYIDRAVGKLIGRGCKMVVLACNTATMAAIKYLRGKYNIPFVGMEPALKPAAESTKTGVIGVLATRAALESDWFRDLKSRYSADTRIITGVGEGFVAAVEQGDESSAESYELVLRAVKPMIDAGVDRIVLGCTHYPFMEPLIRKAVGGMDIEIIDPAPAIVRRVAWLLDENGLRAAEDNVPFYDFLTAADETYRSKLIERARRSTL